MTAACLFTRWLRTVTTSAKTKFEVTKCIGWSDSLSKISLARLWLVSSSFKEAIKESLSTNTLASLWLFFRCSIKVVIYIFGKVGIVDIYILVHTFLKDFLTGTFKIFSFF